MVIIHNIIVPRPTGKVRSDNRNTNIRWECNLQAGEQTFFKGANNIVADPQFVKVARDLRDADFRLRGGEGCLSALRHP